MTGVGLVVVGLVAGVAGAMAAERIYYAHQTCLHRPMLEATMPINQPPDWQHPWLRISVLLRRMLGTRWDAETWPIVKSQLRQTLAMQSAIQHGDGSTEPTDARLHRGSTPHWFGHSCRRRSQVRLPPPRIPEATFAAIWGIVPGAPTTSTAWVASPVRCRARSKR
jgi:hypothetical protein